MSSDAVLLPFRAIFRLGILWSISCAAAAAPLSATEYFGRHFYGTNGVCLSLHIHDPYGKVRDPESGKWSELRGREEIYNKLKH